MSARERNFATYELGDNVLQLGDQVIPEMAEFAAVTLDDSGLVDSLGKLVAAYGTSKVLRENEPPGDLGMTEAADWVKRSGILLPLRRPFITTDGSESLDGDEAYVPNNVVVTGAVANWQDRTAQLLVRTFGSASGSNARVHIVSGNRLMTSGTELTNPNVKEYLEQHGQEPNEAEYAAQYILPVLEEAGMQTTISAYNESDGATIAQKFIEGPIGSCIIYPNADRSREVYGDFAVARVATAGVQLASQFRTAARCEQPSFDRKGALSIYMLTDSLEVAETAEALAQPIEYQSPFTALRQLALTAKLLEEAAIQDSLR